MSLFSVFSITAKKIRAHPQVAEINWNVPHVCWDSEEEQIERNGRQCIYKEPSLYIIYGNLSRLCHHLSVAKVGRSKVDEDVRKEHDVYH